MSKGRFRVTVLDHVCKGCGLCVAFCEQGKLTISPQLDKRGIRVATVQQDADCTGCLRCATICPDAALRIVRIRGPAGTDAGGETSPVSSRHGQSQDTGDE